MIYAAILMCALAHHDLPDGTLLFVEGGNNAVMTHTDSPYSHVAVIFNIDGVPYVYEAVEPVVRKIPLGDYIKEIEAENAKKKKIMKLWVRKPKANMDMEAMREYSESMLGTKYSIRSYLTGEPREGHIHCAELTARTLLKGGVKVHGNPCKKTPQGIMNLCRPYYRKARML